MAITSQITRDAFSGQPEENIASTIFEYSDWYTARYNNVTVQLGCSALSPPATSITYRIEGRPTPTSDRNASIAVGSFSGVSTIDEYIIVNPKISDIRIGGKVDSVAYGSPTGASPLASPNSLYCTFIFTESS